MKRLSVLASLVLGMFFGQPAYAACVDGAATGTVRGVGSTVIASACASASYTGFEVEVEYESSTTVDRATFDLLSRGPVNSVTVNYPTRLRMTVIYVHVDTEAVGDSTNDGTYAYNVLTGEWADVSD